ERQQHCGEQSECERISVSRDALGRMTEHECDRRAKRRNLRKRQIDEDNFSSQNHDAEISMDADQADRHQKRGPEELDDIDHRLVAAFVKAATFKSNSEI